MKPGLVPRLVTSHLLLVALALAVFITALLVVTERRAEEAGMRADQATAVQLAPWIARIRRERGSWDGLLGMFAVPHMDRTMMMRGPMGGRVHGADRELSALVDQPILVLSQTGAVLASRGVDERLIEQRRSRPELGVPIGDASRPLGYLFFGTMVDPASNPMRALFARTTRVAASVTALVVLAAAAIASLLWTRWLVRPLEALCGAAGAVARGQYVTRVPVPMYRDELAELAESFNVMAGKIEAQEEARRRFAGDAAHELRTPLSLMSARVEMLSSGIYSAGDEQWSALRAGIGRMQRLVDDLQTLARLEAGRLELRIEPIDAQVLASRAVTAFEPAARERGICVERTGGPAMVQADVERMDQVLANLVANAIRHSPDGGVVRVGAAADPAAHAVEIWVEDEGPGIPEADRDRVFERFVRLDDARDRAGGGSGLGLAIAAELVRVHGGRIRVGSGRNGRGARFSVFLSDRYA